MATDQPWYKQENAHEASQAVFALIRDLEGSSDTSQSYKNIECARMYSNKLSQELSVSNFFLTAKGTKNGETARNKLIRPKTVPTFNVIASCIDTLTNKIAKNKVKVSFLTTGGTQSQRTKAKQLNKAAFGIQMGCKAHEQYVQVVRDAFLFGTGFLKVYKGKTVKMERVCPDEMRVDPADSYYGKPRSMYQVKLVGVESLIAEYPEHEKALMRLENVNVWKGVCVEPSVMVVEAWRRGKNGRHMICCDGVALYDEPYNKEFFPFAEFRFKTPVTGFWGTGIVDEIGDIQAEINRQAYHISECQRLISVPRVFIRNGSKTPKAQLVNEIGSIIEADEAPTIWTPQAVAPEVYNNIERNIQRAYEMVGISSLSAQALKPSGLDSGRALREYNDIESERFATTALAYEQFVIDSIERAFDLLEDGDVISHGSRDGGLEKLRWGDVKLPKDDYLTQAFPTSALPNTPAGRLQAISELKAEGFITQEDAADLLDYPDLDGNRNIVLSPSRLIMQSLDKILDDGKYVEPDPDMNLELAWQWGIRYSNFAMLKDYPENRKELVRRWLVDVDALKKQAQEQQPQIQPEAAGASLLPSGQQLIPQQPSATM